METHDEQMARLKREHDVAIAECNEACKTYNEAYGKCRELSDKLWELTKGAGK